MPKLPDPHLELISTPRWNVGKGIFYLRQPVPPQGTPWLMDRYIPSARSIGEVLFEKHVSLERRYRIFREGIELVRVFGLKDDLFTLAVLRRQVTRRGGIPMDVLLFQCAALAELSTEEWTEFALRMPDKAPIKDWCHAQIAKQYQLIAAE